MRLRLSVNNAYVAFVTHNWQQIVISFINQRVYIRTDGARTNLNSFYEKFLGCNVVFPEIKETVYAISSKQKIAEKYLILITSGIL